MNPGELVHRITVQQRSEVRAADGGFSNKWINVVVIWARIMHVTGREFTASQAVQNQVTAKIKIRYRTGLMEKMRVLHGSTIYNIEEILDQSGKKDELILMCSKGLSNG